MDEPLGQKRLARPGLPLQHHRQLAPSQHRQPSTNRLHRRIPAPEQLRLFETQRRLAQRRIDADSQRVEILSIEEVGHRLGGQLAVGVDQREVLHRREQHHRQTWKAASDLSENGHPLKPAGPTKARPVTEGEQTIAGHVEVQIEQDHIQLARVALQKSQGRRPVGQTGAHARIVGPYKLKLGHLLGDDLRVGQAIVNDQQPRLDCLGPGVARLRLLGGYRFGRGHGFEPFEASVAGRWPSAEICLCSFGFGHRFCRRRGRTPIDESSSTRTSPPCLHTRRIGPPNHFGTPNNRSTKRQARPLIRPPPPE